MPDVIHNDRELQKYLESRGVPTPIARNQVAALHGAGRDPARAGSEQTMRWADSFVSGFRQLHPEQVAQNTAVLRAKQTGKPVPQKTNLPLDPAANQSGAKPTPRKSTTAAAPAASFNAAALPRGPVDWEIESQTLGGAATIQDLAQNGGLDATFIRISGTPEVAPIGTRQRLSPEDRAGLAPTQQRLTLRAAMGYLHNLDPGALADIQRKLIQGGYITPTEAKAISLGTLDAQGKTMQAWQALLGDSLADSSTTVMDLLNNKAATGVDQQAKSKDTQEIQLTNPDDIIKAGNTTAEKVFGRRLTDGEKSMLVSTVHAQETAAGTRSADIKQSNVDAQSGVATGHVGWVDQSANQLAQQYGLQVTSTFRDPAHNTSVGGAEHSDHLTGMAADLSGDPSKMATFYAWAKQNEGPGKMFSYVEPMSQAKNHVHVSYNAQPGTNPGVSGGGDVDRFMAALSSHEGTATSVNTRTGAHGAYQILPSNWAQWSAEAGLRGAEKTPQNEQTVARFKMQQYYDTFHDWGAVAAAWYGGPGAAQKFLANPNDPSLLRGQGPNGSEPSIRKYVDMVLGSFGTSTAGSGYSTPGGANVAVSVNPATDQEEQLRRSNPTEAGAHDVLDTYEQFMNILRQSHSDANAL